MAKRTVVFMGTPAFAVPSLDALIGSELFDVRHVLTQPDKPVGRKQILTAPPVKDATTKAKIPVLQPVNIKKEWEEIAQQIDRPDYLVVVAYGQLLSQEILDWPLVAPVNVHASLLPKYRGASPIQESLLQGDKETGVTLQKMVKELDAGPILSQKKIAMDPRETSESLFEKLSRLGADLLLEALPHPLTEAKQDDAKATFCRKLSRADGVSDPKTMTAEEIDRKVRALTPWPGVTIGDLKILETDLSPRDDAAPLACKNDTTLFLVRVQVPGKKPVSGAEWMRMQK